MVQITLHLASPMTFLILFFCLCFSSFSDATSFPPLAVCLSLSPNPSSPQPDFPPSGFHPVRFFSLLPHFLQTQASCTEVAGTGVSWPTLPWGPEAWSYSLFLSLAGSFVTAALERGRAPSRRELTV